MIHFDKKEKEKKIGIMIFFSVKNIKFENIGVGYLCKKKKTKKKEKLLNLH